VRTDCRDDCDRDHRDHCDQALRPLLQLFLRGLGIQGDPRFCEARHCRRIA
jgi:hypothetical protein